MKCNWPGCGEAAAPYLCHRHDFEYDEGVDLAVGISMNEQHQADIAQLIDVIRSDRDPTPSDKEALIRVGQRVLTAALTVPESLKRIADAAESLAEAEQRREVRVHRG